MSYNNYIKKELRELQSQVANDFVSEDFIDLTETFEQIGRYVLIRHMRVGEFSENYNPATQESLKGSKYKYDEYLVRVYSVPISEAKSTYSGLMQSIPQVFENIYYQYYLSKECIRVSDNTITETLIEADDEIYELNYFGRQKPTIVYDEKDVDTKNNKVMPVFRYRAKHVIPYKTSNGKLQYLIAITMRDITNG